MNGLRMEGDVGVSGVSDQAEQSLRKGLDAVKLAGVGGLFEGVEDHCGGESGTDFKDALGFLLTDELTEQKGVGKGEPVILRMVTPARLRVLREREAGGALEQGMV